jgi:hypothetical protein
VVPAFTVQATAIRSSGSRVPNSLNGDFLRNALRLQEQQQVIFPAGL